jgi:transposase
MAIGKRRRDRQEELWVATGELVRSPGHPFYERVNQILAESRFDEQVEKLCNKFYAGSVGRPGLAAGVYVRMLLVGYFEGIDSERGIAWRCSDSLALRGFLGLTLSESPPDHSTVSRTRRLIDLETHVEIFGLVLKLLAERGQLSGKTIGVDGTSLEANAAMKSLVRRDTGQSYQDFLVELAKASGIETPTRADLARIDRKRAKKGSNDDWHNPNDPDAQITKMKDGRTHLAHKAEHAVDMDSGAVMAVRIHPGAAGDTTTMGDTMLATAESIAMLKRDPKVEAKLDAATLGEWVADKGYHSNEVLVAIECAGWRAYISEPDRGRRKWNGNGEAERAVHANRRRIRGRRGRELLRRRGERIERTFAHCLETGRMRRTHLRGRENIEKRYLVHVAAYNLGVLMRTILRKGTPRGLQGRAAAFVAACLRAIHFAMEFLACFATIHRLVTPDLHARSAALLIREIRPSTTGC